MLYLGCVILRELIGSLIDKTRIWMRQFLAEGLFLFLFGRHTPSDCIFREDKRMTFFSLTSRIPVPRTICEKRDSISRTLVTSRSHRELCAAKPDAGFRVRRIINFDLTKCSSAEYSLQLLLTAASFFSPLLFFPFF
ncbi:hypothetical protein CDAR_485581 [Caerostris darwini]|uniref:Uncharacterized protein n=1 Tax=Caerostris darwini TaxID=1538125 RepID=A0AAV4R025_9ARAC|nr:hypothetical protein CDAR_485581 [Caerostris darwini]